MSWYSNLVYWLLIKPKLKKLRRQLPEAKIFPCGSRYVCDPPTITTDVDFLVYSENDLTAALLALGYGTSPWRDYFGLESGSFESWRKGTKNLIVSTSKPFCDGHNVATSICKSRNVKRKYHRVMVYEALRGNKEFFEIMPDAFCPKLKGLLENLTGPHGPTLIKTYMIQYGVEPV